MYQHSQNVIYISSVLFLLQCFLHPRSIELMPRASPWTQDARLQLEEEPMMELPDVTATLTGVSSALGLTWLSWNGRMKGRQQKLNDEIAALRAQREAQLQGCYVLRTHDDIYERTSGNGGVAVALLGTYGSSQLPLLIDLWARMGVSSSIGGILLAQLNDEERDACLRIIQEQHPEFLSRITLMSCANLPGGFQGMNFQKAFGAQYYWEDDVTTAISNWLRYLDHQTRHEILLVYVSPGSHSAVLPILVKQYRERYVDKPIYAVTALEDREVKRECFPDIHRALSKICSGVIINDNSRGYKETDQGNAALLSGLIAGGWISGSSLQLGNVLQEVFSPQRSSRYATTSVWMEELPVHYLEGAEGIEEIYYTKEGILQEKILRGITTIIDSPELQGMPLERADEGNTRVIMVVAPIIPEEGFSRLVQRIEGNLKSWRKVHKNIIINFASIGTELTPTTTQSQVIVALLHPLTDDGTHIDALALGKHAIDPKFLNDEEDEVWQSPTIVPALPPARRGRPPRNNGQPQGEAL